MAERGITVDHVTLYRWIQRYAPELREAGALVPGLPIVVLARGRDLVSGWCAGSLPEHGIG